MRKLSIILPTLIIVAVAAYFMKYRGALIPSNDSPTSAVESESHETTPASQSAPAVENTKTAQSKTPEQTCYAYEYRHTDEAKSKDIEDFLDFSNAFPIHHAGVSPKSICVRVNQKPVPFQVVKNKKREEIMIGSVVGPESIIRVSYCLGKASCMEACPVAKKRFMDDMMNGALDDDVNVSADVKNKAKELRALASQNKDLNDHSVIRNWTTLKTQEWKCKK